MLAAMNGHVPAVKLLLDMGSDINAQIETNRNTALTLACFQGRAEVVSLLLDRKANVEHRAKVRILGYVDHFMLIYVFRPNVWVFLFFFYVDWAYTSDGGSLRRLCRGWSSAARQRSRCQCPTCSVIQRHCPNHCC